MGFLHAVVLSSVSFVLGVLFVCLNVDHRLLYQVVTEQAVADGFLFYTTFYNAPPAIKTLLHTVVGAGLAGLLGKLHKWDESAMFFDGSCIVAYIFSIAVYLSVTVPALRTIAEPLAGVDTRLDRIEAMRVLGAGNTIVILLLGGILCLQGGQEYARRAEAKALAKLEAQQKGNDEDKPVASAAKKND